ncbi:MAG: copper homeostasis protein CutC [Bacteroidales bacterium]|jgi:copper homeostasis protein
MNIQLEICAGSLTSAINAWLGGTHRIELCDNLPEGGTTPSPGVIRQCVELLEIPVFVLIRPRAGDFLYTPEEFEAMKEDIAFCKEHGAKGVVLGILCDDSTVDKERTGALVRLACPMQVTFHRAFDMTIDPFQAMEDIISLGIDRILTSGQAASARDGVPLIRQLIRKAAGRIIIMPGGGIAENNVTDLLSKTGAKEIHASLRSPVKSGMRIVKNIFSMGMNAGCGDSWFETNPERVRHMMNLLMEKNF